MSSCSSGITGCKLADLEILTVCPHETFISLVITCKLFHELSTGECKNQLYEARVRHHMPEFVCLVGIFPQDEKNKWKEVYDAGTDFLLPSNPLHAYLDKDLEGLFFFNTTSLELFCHQLKDELFYQILAINRLSQEPFIETIVEDYTIKDHIFRNGAFRLLKWIDSIGLLEHAMAHKIAGPDDVDYPIRSIIRSGNLDMLKWIILEKGYPLMDAVFRCVENGKNETANIAVRSGHIHILEWLKSQGCLPDAEGARRLTNDNKCSKTTEMVLNWMQKNGIDVKYFRDYSKQNRSSGKEKEK